MAARLGEARKVVRLALRRRMIPEDRREKAVALVLALPADASAQVLVRQGALTQGQLDELLAESARDSAPPRTTGFRSRAFGPDYVLVDRLGSGGMGVVYKAFQWSLRRFVALKVVRTSRASRDEQVRRFQTTGWAVARCRHPNIVPVHHVGVYKGVHFLTQALVEGRSLHDVLCDGGLDLRASLEILEKVARAAHALHDKGLVHRDLKPDNILVDGRGEPFIVDFDLAQDVSAELEPSESDSVVGTPAYMAPEQASYGATTVDSRADIYALGAILYEMLTGRPPLLGRSDAGPLDAIVEREPEPPGDLVPSLPDELEAICLKCLSKEPWRRYPSAEELADDIRRWLDGEPTLAHGLPRGRRRGKRPTRGRVLAPVILLLGLLLAALASGWVTL